MVKKHSFDDTQLYLVNKDLVEMKGFLRTLKSSKPVDDTLGLEVGEIEFMLSATADDYFQFKELYLKVLEYLKKLNKNK